MEIHLAWVKQNYDRIENRAGFVTDRPRDLAALRTERSAPVGIGK